MSDAFERNNSYGDLFVSSLAPGAAADSVISIAKQARRNNERTRITGLLVFDGKHFAQLMEGPTEAVVTMADRMITDPRHEDGNPAPRPRHVA